MSALYWAFAVTVPGTQAEDAVWALDLVWAMVLHTAPSTLSWTLSSTVFPKTSGQTGCGSYGCAWGI